ncbi:hypothetical protein FT663_02148 [Candidozyma haemuli var. vulneris]|uniref:Prefoldin subunit 1 n=1 Tax=Candidozyma haemuli TaxID=45357 RepID=A0A2V1AM09_9ASCO|nr:hypothetical protein CXQ85_001158 [[Candida] haemuloni]KAF3990407.1 hypothetical protein FT662_02301 [[Candida] haemuloni var. vulneris]KAF3992839.1 hypothetical protein FT663_02148 [[Candida] haemuloni var. vulneris]PVH18868.1 hypothetical protein CXQ85_001158 [[Candida] haemuloni]
MSLDPQALQKLLVEMDNQLNKSRAELNMCNVQLERVNTNVKIIDSTTGKLKKLTNPGDNVWQGVGKAFVMRDVDSYVDKIGKDKKEFLETQDSLKKKQNYLETTLEKTIDNMAQISGFKK